MHAECIVTQLVFEHSLHIRIRSEAPQSAQETRFDPGRGSPSVPHKVNAGKSTASTGKINNLVSTDMGNITDAGNFLLILLYVPLQIILCIVFLYAVLGWRLVRPHTYVYYLV